ncbi:class I SAM-dependent methyltransferase [Gimesia aquarii]|uniref:Uncharacterized protein n=1 Tax=Gimesia aquarii TaxID=2527964 RepID=A0A517WNZ8_9PLAN|nr:class I SAM-dependent methyltransferase [Gimesia aquarii]QDU06963.1 hypothetical protein V202x_03080 [Gimesia aquarii]
MTTACHFTSDLERIELFEQKLQEIINQSSLALMISVGHRTGLFDTLEGTETATRQEIADRAGLFEHYVGAWLTTMVAGGILEYDSMFKTYRLPPEHAVWLTRSTDSKNYAVNMQWFSIFSKLEDEIVKSFREGDRIPHSLFASLQSEMDEEQSKSAINGLFKYVLPLVPNLIMQLCEGIDVLELDCGSGSTLLELAAIFPKSRFVGYDDSEELIESANRIANERNIENITFINRDISQIHAINSFDLITAFDVLHYQEYPFQVLDEAFAALRPGGIVLIQDIATPSNLDQIQNIPMALHRFAVSNMRWMTASRGKGSAGWEKEMMCQTLEDIGFAGIEVHELPHDILSYYYVAERPNAESYHI